MLNALQSNIYNSCIVKAAKIINKNINKNLLKQSIYKHKQNVISFVDALFR